MDHIMHSFMQLLYALQFLCNERTILELFKIYKLNKTPCIIGYLQYIFDNLAKLDLLDLVISINRQNEFTVTLSYYYEHNFIDDDNLADSSNTVMFINIIILANIRCSLKELLIPVISELMFLKH